MFKGKNAKLKFAMLIIVIILVIVFVLFGTDILNTLSDVGFDLSDYTSSGENGSSSGDYSSGGDDGVVPSSGVVNLDDDTFSIHFVDVGQGDAIIIRLPDGKDILIDAGSGTSEKTATTEDYLAYLAGIDIGTIDYLIATHAHSDHMNMMDDVLDMFEVEHIMYNSFDTEPTTVYYQSFLEGILAEGATTTVINYSGEIITIEPEDDSYDYCITLYCMGYGTLSGSVNNDSPIILVEYAGRSILLTGDAEVEGEEWFMEYCIANDIEINVDLLKLGHHGSDTSTSYEFLEFVDPEYGVISSGENSYGHPSESVLDDLATYGVATYRTDTHGDIVFVVDADGNFVFMVQNAVSTENNTYNFEEYMELIGG